MSEENEEKENITLRSVSAIAQYVGMSPNTTYKMRHETNLPMYLVGGVWYADTEDLDEWRACQKRGEWYGEEPSKNIKISEAAEQMCMMHGVCPLEVEGSGKEGQIIEKDVKAVIKSKTKKTEDGTTDKE